MKIFIDIFFQKISRSDDNNYDGGDVYIYVSVEKFSRIEKKNLIIIFEKFENRLMLKKKDELTKMILKYEK